MNDLLVSLRFLDANPELTPTVIIKSVKLTRQVLEVVLNLVGEGILISEVDKRFFRSQRNKILIHKVLLPGVSVKEKQCLLASHRKFVKKVVHLGLKHFEAE